MAKAPKQIYVTAKSQDEMMNGVPIKMVAPLGFLNAYEPAKAAFISKKRTQEEWAYQNYLQNFKLEQFGPDFIISGLKYDWSQGAGRQQVQVNEPVDPRFAPKIWDNDPIAGFKIEKSVSRYSTSNKLWRILDPRGIEFEVSTGCLEMIIENATILKGGTIDAECQWISNKNLVVVS